MLGPKGLFDLRSIFQGRHADTMRTLVLVGSAIVLSSFVIWMLGRFVGFGDDSTLGQLLRQAANSSWAIPAVIATFIAGSFVGAPQFLLIALAVGAFGPLQGFFLAYIATLISASVNFGLARWFGAEWLRRRRGETLKKLVDVIGRNGFMSAMVVRIIPSAPFIVVNMALGLTTVPYLTFLAGTGIGIIPKTAIVAILGKVVERALAGDLDAIVYVLLAVAVWVVLAIAARKLVQRQPQLSKVNANQSTPS